MHTDIFINNSKIDVIWNIRNELVDDNVLVYPMTNDMFGVFKSQGVMQFGIFFVGTFIDDLLRLYPIHYPYGSK